MLPSFFAVLTFAVGVSFTLLSHRFVPATVSLCELAQHPWWHHGALVRVDASAFEIYGAVFIRDGSCNANRAWVVVMRDDSFQPSREVETFMKGSRPEIRKAEVLVIGRFNKDATRGCFGPRFGIHASRVELRSALTIEPVEHHQ